jgi:metal iron transporter
LNIPLVGGCAITLVDVLLILLFYRPNGSISRLRVFEFFVASLVIAVVVCFCIQLSLLKDTTAGQVLYGYIPSSAVVSGNGIWLSCGILGATVMPHSIYLGSGLVQPRVFHYDEVNGTGVPLRPAPSQTEEKIEYQPSIQAIRYCLKYSVWELCISLTGFALFVNSAILIVAGSSLSTIQGASDADLFGIYNLLSLTITKGAATVFAIALFFSGTAAGIVCTIAGQMVAEGHIRWKTKPWLRRLLTRSVSITPSIIIAGAIGRDGLSAALNATQVALSIVLPFLTAPLIYFTCRDKFMTVGGSSRHQVVDGVADDVESTNDVEGIPMRNHWVVNILAVLIWLVITIMNVVLLVLLGLGNS